jgi:hypothetical protein
MAKPRRTILLVMAVISGIAVIALIALWIVPSWLTMHPHLSTPAQRHKAEADTRTGVVALLAVLGGIAGLYYTSRTVRLSREAQTSANRYANETSRLGQQTLALSEQGQITDRYSKRSSTWGARLPRSAWAESTPWGRS